MALVEQKVRLRMLRPELQPTIFAVRDDTGRAIICTIEDWEIPDGAVAKIIVEKPSGEIASGDCTISDGEITAPLTDEMLSEDGKAAFCIEFTADGQTATTFRALLYVGQKADE